MCLQEILFFDLWLFSDEQGIKGWLLNVKSHGGNWDLYHRGVTNDVNGGRWSETLLTQHWHRAWCLAAMYQHIEMELSLMLLVTPALFLLRSIAGIRWRDNIITASYRGKKLSVILLMKMARCGSMLQVRSHLCSPAAQSSIWLKSPTLTSAQVVETMEGAAEIEEVADRMTASSW